MTVRARETKDYDSMITQRCKFPDMMTQSHDDQKIDHSIVSRANGLVLVDLWDASGPGPRSSLQEPPASRRYRDAQKLQVADLGERPD